MSASTTQAAPQPDPGPLAADTPYYRGILHGMIDRGADLTRALHELAVAQAMQLTAACAQQAAAHAKQSAARAAPQTPDAPQDTDAQPALSPAPGAMPGDPIKTAASFDQIARAVRRCIFLAQNLDAPKQQPASHPAQDRTTARRRIIRAVEDVIQRPPDNPECDDAEVLLADLRERMDAPDLDDDIANRPAEDIIKEILRDLGLAALPGSRPWKRRTPADIAELNASAAAPSSPASNTAHSPSPDPQYGAGTAQPSPGPEPDRREPGQPARPPVHPGHTLPKDPAEAVAFVLRQAARTNVRWRPPPGD